MKHLGLNKFLFFEMNIKFGYNIHRKRLAIQQPNLAEEMGFWVEETIKSPDEIKRKGHKYYVTKKLNGRILKVVYVKERYINVVTTFFIE